MKQFCRLFFHNFIPSVKKNRIKLLFSGFLFISAAVYGSDDYSLEARFLFETNDEIKYSDQYQLKAELEYDFEVSENIECELELEADKYEIDVEEVFFQI